MLQGSTTQASQYALQCALQVLDAGAQSVPGAAHSDCIMVSAAAYVETSSSGREYAVDTRLTSGIQQGSSYNIWAVAKSSNKPSAVPMADFCDPAPLQPCPTADPPCVQGMEVACECIGHHQAQLTLTVATRAAGVDAAHLVHYVIMIAALSSGAQFDTAAFPRPTVAQIRAGNIAGVPVAANGSFCVPEGNSTTVTVPPSDGADRLGEAQQYVICLAPPDGPNGLYCPDADHLSANGSPQPICRQFSTYNHSLNASCTLSGCTCSSDADCNAKLACSATGNEPASVQYRVSPSSCGGLQQVTCADLLDPEDRDCCPAMEDPLAQVLDCCQTIAQASFEMPQTSPHSIAGMPSCGNIDVLAYALSTACHRCNSPRPQYCTEISGYAAQEQARQEACSASTIGWQAGDDGICMRVVPAVHAGPAPNATVCSGQQLSEGIQCGADKCAPELCGVTVCEPRSDGACSAVPGANHTVFAIGDSPGTVCCMALPYGHNEPSVSAILAGQLPNMTQAAGHSCEQFTSARQWQELAFAGLDNDVLYMVRCSHASQPVNACNHIGCWSCVQLIVNTTNMRCKAHLILHNHSACTSTQAWCAANDTSGNAIIEPGDAFIAPPQIINPTCIGRASCDSAGITARLSVSLTVPGEAAYLLLEEGQRSADVDVDQVFSEAAQPDELRAFMEQVDGDVDSTHHGFVSVPERAVSIAVPVTMRDSISYELVLAARFNASQVPCCYSTPYAQVKAFPGINATFCTDPDCCSPAETLQELQPVLRFADSFALPMGPMQARRTGNASEYEFEQLFALVGARPGSTGTVQAYAGGMQLYDSPSSGRSHTAAQLQSRRRPPASAKIVLQQETLYDEAEGISGMTEAGRTLHVRYASF